MPQFQVETYFSQIFWLFFCFLFLFLISTYFTLPTLFKVFNERKKVLISLHDEVNILKKEVTDIRSEIKFSLDSANKKFSDMVSEAERGTFDALLLKKKEAIDEVRFKLRSEEREIFSFDDSELSKLLSSNISLIVGDIVEEILRDYSFDSLNLVKK